MAPPTSFNFFMHGFASVAAKLGYNKTMASNGPANDSNSSTSDEISSRTSQSSMNTETSEPSSSASSSPAKNAMSHTVIAAGTKSASTKRKREDDESEEECLDLSYPANLKAIYPTKRRRQAPELVELESVKQSEAAVDQATVDAVDTKPQSEPTSSSASKPESQPSGPVLDSPALSSPAFHAVSDLDTPKVKPSALPPSPFKPLPRSPIRTASNITGGFASFATLSPSRFVVAQDSSSTTSLAPAWTQENRPGDISAFQNPQSGPVLAMEKAPSSTESKKSVPTGEEDEDVLKDVRGVRLYIKRGDSAISSGIVGQVKLLSTRNEEKPKKRLLFRREPLRKISMNKRLGSDLRCYYDAEECTLRVVCMEDRDETQIVVLYALRPGKFCSKVDFQEFAETVMSQLS